MANLNADCYSFCFEKMKTGFTLDGSLDTVVSSGQNICNKYYIFVSYFIITFSVWSKWLVTLNNSVCLCYVCLSYYIIFIGFASFFLLYKLIKYRFYLYVMQSENIMSRLTFS